MTAAHPRALPELPPLIRSVHIIGICGTAMGSLAAMLAERGLIVQGSDAMAYPPMSTWLEERGISIMMGYDERNLDWGPDLVVIGNVVRATYADAVAAKRRGIPTLSLPEALKHFFLKQKRSLTLTGTHGKTTTTSMLAWIMDRAGRAPSFMVGGITGNFGSNYRLGEGDCFVIEGDEYDTAYFDKVPKFWHYSPYRATINNIEFDHADIYPDVEAIEQVFRRFVALIPEQGSLWINGDDERAVAVAERARCAVHTFGLGPFNTLRAEAIRPSGASLRANVFKDKQPLGEFELPMIGEFNVRNMLGALALALDEGVEVDVCREAFATFRSVKKRQEIIGEVHDVLVIDDFAHHPSAVDATLKALRARYGSRRLRVAFEAKSNTSRRKVFQDAYPEAFAHADEVILSKPWKKDELPPEQLLDIGQLRDDIEALGPPTRLMPDVSEIIDELARSARPGDVIAGLSGSSFERFHPRLVEALEARWPRDGENER